MKSKVNVATGCGRVSAPVLGVLGVLGFLALAAPLAAQSQSQSQSQVQSQFRQEIGNDMAHCTLGSGPAVRVTVEGIKSSSGTIRVQSYRAVKTEWLKKGKWLNRIEAPAQAGTMQFCMPVSQAGLYGIAVRHDTNGNGKTDLRRDGGAMSNNPSINIFNLGRPSYKKTGFEVGPGIKSISVRMRYM